LILEYHVRELNHFQSGRYGHISLGSEVCVLELLYFNFTALLEQALHDKCEIRLLTPFIPDKHMEQTYELVKNICAIRQIKVTFNDTGLLHRCKCLIDSGLITPVIGRLLTRSLVDCPWADLLIQDESSALKESVYGYSMVHNSKWEILNAYNINEIEMNYHPVMDKSVSYFAEKGVSITTYENHLLSVGRICYQSRYVNKAVRECEHVCMQPLQINLQKRFIPSENVGDETAYQKYFSNCYVMGNAVYTQNDGSVYKGISYMICQAKNNI